MNASACIYMYCNIESNIMKIQSSSPDVRIKGKISTDLFYILIIVYFSIFRICLYVIFVQG